MTAPKPAAHYSNQAPSWSWPQINSLNAYEIEILDDKNNVVHHEVLNNVNQYTYTEGLQNGKSYLARIRGSINHGGTWEIWSPLSSITTIDTVKPTAELNRFLRVGADTAKVIFSSHDNLSGVVSGNLQIATSPDFATILKDQEINVNSDSIQVSGIDTSVPLYARLKVTDKAGNSSDYSKPLALSLAKPVLISPVNQSIIKKPNLHVQGTAESSGQVQFYLNDKPVGMPVSVDEQGVFSQDIQLDKEGSYQLIARLNQADSSSESQPVTFNFVLPAPMVSITAPIDQQQLLAPIDIQVNAADEFGIEKVAIYIDDQLLSTLTAPPYKLHWPLTLQDNGKHTVTTKVTNTNGKVTSKTHTVNVNIAPPAPPPPPYIGKITNVSPKLSYGEQPITITGKALNRSNNTTAANASLILVLETKGFTRQFALATDEQGNFSYTFKPQANDSGDYKVSVIHPDDTTITAQSSFSINRITFNVQRYQLKMPVNTATSLNINATASTDTKQLRWVLAADQQPNGQLPQGIRISAEPVDIKAGETRMVPVQITADETASKTGTFYLTAHNAGSGNLIRGKLQVNYQIGVAAPTLKATPSYIQTGLAQGSSTNAEIQLANIGLVNAEDIQLQLLNQNGQPAPEWLFIVGDKTINRINASQSAPIQIMVQPDNQVAEGVYHFNLSISARNMPSGTIPVSISVNQSGQGSVQFDVADIYTATLDENGQVIAGVKNATIKLQNEKVLTQEYTLTTNNEGIASLDKLPVGTYRYRASADNHQDSSGRIVIRPGVTTQQHLFLDYQTVNVEFGVTETHIKDVYDVEVNATFNTQVPTPVVLIEPMSVNLGDMQTGEIKTGQLTITNYGLTQTKNLTVTLPKTDDRFKYEFFGEVPDVLLPKEQKVISYRITALDQNLTRTAQDSNLSRAKKTCTRYTASYTEKHESECANGDIARGDSSGSFYQYKGSDCNISGAGQGDTGMNFTSSTSNGGLSNSSSSKPSPVAIPLTSGCNPDAPCSNGGASSGNR